jgi:N-acetylneuraminate synthase
MTKALKIGSKSVGPDSPPYLVAELSGNHNGRLERALALVDAAAQCGADAVKLQTYTADTMTIDEPGGDFLINDPTSLWNGRTLYELYGEASTPWEWHEAIFQRARDLGIDCFSTPFDLTALDYLESFEPPAYKIASFELNDPLLIKAIAAKGRPLIMSTGMATYEDIRDAVRSAQETGNDQIILLQCTSTYPASPENSHIRTITKLREDFSCNIGLSDHTAGIGAAIAAVALGAVLVEKHFTLSRNDGGVDAAFSMEPAEFALLVSESERAWQALGVARYGPLEAELTSLRFRRSIYVTENIVAGELLTPKNIRVIRPGYGLSPKFYTAVLGRPSATEIKRGTPLSWELLA